VDEPLTHGVGQGPSQGLGNGGAALRSDDAPIEPVHIRIAPDARLLLVVRLAAGAVGSLAGLDVDLIDDVKLAVSESVLALIEHGSGEPIDVELSAGVRGDAPSVGIVARTKTHEIDRTNADFELCWSIIQGVSESCAFEHSDGLATIAATIRDVAAG
jgi:hypothetical protein